ncbi:MAG TPA: discoidin domain-containing protein [Candidatus Acidoferrales bacterium]|jgi:hypothetical protein|nr:discoidin domain-containing protein [Candidatus Acidoferrales bacterium]
MTHKLLLCFALALIGFVLSAMPAKAQPGGDTIHTSLEARILQARAVFRGTITNVSDTILHDIPSAPTNVSHNYTFTLTVDEVLKGTPPRQPLTFTVNHVARWLELERSATAHGSFLWFVDGSEKTIGHDFFAGLNPPSFVYLGPPLVWQENEGGFDLRTEIYDMDLTLLTNPQQILARARAFARKRTSAATLHRIYLPEHSTSDHYFSSSYLVVPVGPGLEKTAKHLLAAPGDFITRTNEPDLIPQWRCDLRTDGVDALQYFKTAQNIELLKSLLADPDCWMIRTYLAQHRELNVTNKTYSVRSKAYDVLHGWGVDVPKPVTSETVLTNGTAVTLIQLVVVRADSPEIGSQTGSGAYYALDGDPNTYWHTQWQGASPGLPHEITIELFPSSVIKGFTYLPRQDVSDHGTIKDYEFYVSDDGTNFGQPVKTGTFDSSKSEKVETFEPVNCRFIKLRALSEITGQPWTSAAEIRVIQTNEEASAKDYWQGNIGRPGPAASSSHDPAKPDALDAFVTMLSADGGLWINGTDAIDGIQAETPEDVVSKTLRTAKFEAGMLTSYWIVSLRKIHLGEFPDDYTAALLDTNVGQMVMLMQYTKGNDSTPGHWWRRIYDAHPPIKRLF